MLAEAIPRAIETHGSFVPAMGGEVGFVLDIGCGRQPFRELLEQRGWTYEGLDTQQNSDGSVRFVAAIDGTLPPELAAHPGFGLILCTEVLEHVAHWDAAFVNIASLLAPGGRVVITCPHSYPLHEQPYDFWRPTDHAIRAMALRHGLEVIACERLGSGWDVIGTNLASFSPVPAKGGVPLVSHALAGITRLLRGLLFRLIASGALQSQVADRSPLYQSNLAVLGKPRV